MRQLPLVLVLALSTGLLLWNFWQYEPVVAAERDAGEEHASGPRAPAASTDALEPERPRTLGSGPGTGRLLAAERGARDETRVALALPIQGPELPPDSAEAPGEAAEEEYVHHSPEGHVRAQGKLVDGKRVGRWVEWWSADQRMSEGDYVGGRRHGPWTFWHENGEIDHQGAYEMGAPEGPWTWNHTNGAVRLTLSFTDGKSQGVMQEWHDDGTLLREGHYSAGEPDGRWVESHPDGTPRSETHYLNGVRHGSHRAWYTSGELKEQGEYRQGLREGRWLFYDGTGNPAGVRSGIYEEGRRVN